VDRVVTAAPPPVVAVVGPTATGKTALAVALAGRLGGEVVNADSMQLYRGMDIGTAKPDLAERGGVPHHLLDLWPVRQAASVAEYRTRARAEIDRLRAAGVVPFLVGGSGLYVRAVLDELDFPGTDAPVRARLEAELADLGPAELHGRLARLDPAAAAAVLPSNGRRIVRALEVIELTGGPFRAQLPEPRPHYPAVTIGLDRAPAELDERIAARVDRMWRAGFVAEVEALVGEGLREGPTASRALGYAQVLAQFDGELSADEARERTVSTTRRFVRRQRSWFRRDAGLTWFDADRADLVGAVTAEITARTIGP
jgi:tRNA dimethylallyltransferase